MSWTSLTPAPEGTHHLRGAAPAYEQRFDEVLAFHAPGLAPVRRAGRAWHINHNGDAAYARRFIRTFGFYEGLAAVVGADGWHHITPDGGNVSEARHAWCGNFQGGRCTVRDDQQLYVHVDREGRPVYDARWRYAGDFRDGVAVVQADDGRSTHIDAAGNFVHGRWFVDLDVFHKGLARARDVDGWTHVDRRGEPAYARRFAQVEPFYNGQARVERSDGAFEVIDESGTTVCTLRPARESVLQRLSGQMVGFWRTQAIRSAVELGVMDSMPGSVEEIAARAALDVDMTRRLLRALWELDLVVPSRSDWGPTPAGALLQRMSGSGMADAALHWATEHYQAWDALPTALKSGRSGFEAVFGMGYFNWLDAHPESRRRFDAAMSGYARHDYAALGAQLDLRGVRCVLDAGGGAGHLLWAVLAACPDAQGILLDLPDVVRDVDVPVGCASRVRVVGADLFAPWPCEADCILLARVLHDWDDIRARMILARAAEVLPPGGTIRVIEWVVRDDTPAGSLLDLNMLAVCGSRERSLADWSGLAASVELRVSETLELPAYGYAMTLRGAV